MAVDITNGTNTGKFAGVWATRSEPHLVYRILPKCACSSIAQIFHYLDTGSFYEGNVHEKEDDFLRWGKSTAGVINEIISNHHVTFFTFVRNPYARVLSAFVDKIFSYQPKGTRYFGGDFHKRLESYGVSWDADSNLIRNFSRFLHFVADNADKEVGFGSDIHWEPFTLALSHNVRINPYFHFDFVGHVERFGSGLKSLVQIAGIRSNRLPIDVPRENSLKIPEMTLHDFYGAEEIELVQKIYANDFRLFNYDLDPRRLTPIEPIVPEHLLSELNALVTAARRTN